MTKTMPASADAAYVPGAADDWTGRVDDEAPCRIHQIITPLNIFQQQIGSNDSFNIALLGCAVEEGVRRNKGIIGAREGPVALRKALANKIIHGASAFSLFDAGTIIGSDDLEATQASLANAVKMLRANHITPIVLGGGHEIAFGHFRGLSDFAKGTPIGVINIDAHFDLRPLLEDGKGSSGTPFLQMAHLAETLGTEFPYLCIGVQRAANSPSLFATMKKIGGQYVLAEDMLGESQQWQLRVKKFIADNQYIYLSICLDAFAFAYAPGVSAPQPLGLAPSQIMPTLKEIVSSGKIIGLDIAELCPPRDINNQTAQLGATIIADLVQALLNTRIAK